MAMELGRPWRERKRWRDAGCGGEADPLFHVKATIVVGRGGEIKTSGAMLGPRLSGEGRVEIRRQQVVRGDGWDGRQSRRGHDGDRGRRRERG